jgi:hypothetical protein
MLYIEQKYSNHLVSSGERLWWSSLIQGFFLAMSDIKMGGEHPPKFTVLARGKMERIKIKM